MLSFMKLCVNELKKRFSLRLVTNKTCSNVGTSKKRRLLLSLRTKLLNCAFSVHPSVPHTIIAALFPRCKFRGHLSTFLWYSDWESISVQLPNVHSQSSFFLFCLSICPSVTRFSRWAKHETMLEQGVYIGKTVPSYWTWRSAYISTCQYCSEEKLGRVSARFAANVVERR